VSGGTSATLRPLRWWDIADVVPLELQLFPDNAWTAETFWAELAAEPARAYLVAEDDDGSVVGYAGLSCAVTPRGGEAEVMTLAVAPRAQGRGVGAMLLAALRDIAVLRGAGRLMLEVRADNQAARALYAAAGFEQVGVRAAYYRSGGRSVDGEPARPVDALVLRLPLPEPTPGPDSVPR
jgi:[ribosomal protein S18]-alanine N-acetyltransferase